MQKKILCKISAFMMEGLRQPGVIIDFVPKGK